MPSKGARVLFLAWSHPEASLRQENPSALSASADCTKTVLGFIWVRLIFIPKIFETRFRSRRWRGRTEASPQRMFLFLTHISFGTLKIWVFAKHGNFFFVEPKYFLSLGRHKEWPTRCPNSMVFRWHGVAQLGCSCFYASHSAGSCMWLRGRKNKNTQREMMQSLNSTREAATHTRTVHTACPHTVKRKIMDTERINVFRTCLLNQGENLAIISVFV